MSETAASWLPWRGVHTFANGVETAFHHPLIEFRRPGDAASRCIDPMELLDEDNLAGAEWRPMLWGREGAANRRMHDEAVAESITRAEDGYLLARFGSSFEQIYEGVGLSDVGAQRWVEDLARCKEWCAARGGVYRLLVVPETHSVYPDKVAGNPAPHPNRPIMRILRAADAAVRECIVYPLREMVEGRARHATCSRDDLHFTSFGAFLCYRALLETLPGCAPERTLQESDLIRQEGPTIGGYGHMLGLDRYHDVRLMAPHVPYRKVLKDSRFAVGHVDVLETDFPELPTMMTFRTSNTTALFTYYLRHFSRIVAVAGRPLLPDLIESEVPHVVILEIPERVIAGSVIHPGHNPDMPQFGRDATPFEEFTGFPLPLPRTHPQRPLPG